MALTCNNCDNAPQVCICIKSMPNQIPHYVIAKFKTFQGFDEKYASVSCLMNTDIEIYTTVSFGSGKDEYTYFQLTTYLNTNYDSGANLIITQL